MTMNEETVSTSEMIELSGSWTSSPAEPRVTWVWTPWFPGHQWTSKKVSNVGS